MESDFIETLFEYQTDGVSWLIKKRLALLADEMGLGKSAQVITTADRIGAKRILVICPAVARINWVREFQKFSNTSRGFTILLTTKDEIPTQSIIVSYDLLTRLSATALGDFDLILIDEIHYAKNTKTQRTHAIFGKKGIIHEQKPSTKIWVLSGTPAPNHAGELWPLLFTFGKTRLNYEDFIQRFCTISKRTFGKKVFTHITGTKRERIPELRSILAQVMLRRTKEEVGHMLPKIFYSNILVEPGEIDLTVEDLGQNFFSKTCVADLEEKLKKELTILEGAVNTKDIEVLKGLAKSVSTLRRYIGAQKVEKAAELISGELKAGLYKKIVVFAIHQSVIEGLRVRLKDYHPLTLYGGSKFNTAHGNIDKFQNNSKYQVFIGNIQACGIAINLTASHNVLMVEQEWTPASNAQAIARCHRHGQKNSVSVRIVSLANSLDEKIGEILKKKTSELTDIFDKDTKPDLELKDLLS